MEGRVTKAPAPERKSSTRGSGKSQAAGTRAPSVPSQAAPDLKDAAPRQGSCSGGSESLREKKPPVRREKQPSVKREKQPPVVQEKQPPVRREKQPSVRREKQPPVKREKQPPVVQEKQPPVVQEKQPSVKREKQPPVVQEKQPSVKREKQPPVVQEKQPPVVREKQPPVVQEKQPSVKREKQPSVRREEQSPVVREKQPPVVQEKQPSVKREKQPSVRREEQPPVVREKQPPVVQEKQPSVKREKQPSVRREEQPPVVREKQPPVVQEKQPSVKREKQPSVRREEQPPVVREKQPPVVQEKQPSVKREKQPSIKREKQPPVVQEKQPPVVQEKQPPVVQEKLPVRAPESQSGKKGLPHPEDGHTLRDRRPVLKEDQSLGVATSPSSEPGTLPKKKRDPANLNKKVLRQNSDDWKPTTVAHNLRLRSQDVSKASKLVNKVVHQLLQKLPLYDSAFRGIEALRTGSYYELVKISVPNEFDVMLKLKVSRVKLEEYDNSGAFHFVKFKRNPKGNPLNKFLDNEILSASKLQSQFRKLIKEEVTHMKEMDITVERKKPTSPAVTLLIRKPEEISVDIVLALESKSSWPSSTQGGLAIENWLGRKIKRKYKFWPVYLIPKPVKEGNGFQGNIWRLSFSHIEKDMLKDHGSAKKCCEKGKMSCCRKPCLKLMKYLLEQLKKKFENHKGLKKFHSYHMKTAFFHLCVQKPHDNQWQKEDLQQCFDNCVTYFLHCLQIEQLIHFFIPKCNLFSHDLIDKTSQMFLLKQIEFQRNNMFPVFDE
ncbi:cyclic GMP-AMP synthase isoform X1 [Sminthopsis crassicaudata]|uniref:cyclic GMP-AMP synthase isoform X1 n=1 Tax=Sminthopsis crassicaudata TaxID=9301 RepID=UPI003D68FE1B